MIFEPPLLCGGTTAFTAKVAHSPKRKKIIEWGAEPNAAFFKENISKVKLMPFDGAVLPLRTNNGTNVTWKMWGPIRWEYSNFARMAEDLMQTPLNPLSERFIRVNVTPGNVDWFDDRAWSNVLHNFALAARVAKGGNCKGFMFDVEQYEHKLFSLAGPVTTFNAQHAKVRQRGREWIAAVAGEFPDILILMPWAYLGITNETYLLLADFLDGIFEAAPPSVRLVDAGEGSYHFKHLAQFQKAYETVRENASSLSAVPGRYKARVEVAFGIWVDADWDKIGWHRDDLNKNFFSPRDFETSVSHALETSDEYVWIYTQKLNWWTGKNLPFAYVEALNAAKERSQNSGQVHYQSSMTFAQPWVGIDLAPCRMRF